MGSKCHSLKMFQPCVSWRLFGNLLLSGDNEMSQILCDFFNSYSFFIDSFFLYKHTYIYVFTYIFPNSLYNLLSLYNITYRYVQRNDYLILEPADKYSSYPHIKETSFSKRRPLQKTIGPNEELGSPAATDTAPIQLLQ